MADDNFNQRLNDALKRNDIDLTGDVPIVQDDSAADFSAANSGLATGMRIGLEFMSGTVVGFLLGWGIDSYFKTTPWFLLIFTILGFCAGVMNVYRSINDIDEGVGINRRNVLTKAAGTTTSKPTD